MLANLHLHSTYSDGTLLPASIAERARSVGLECVALTDHDTLSGTPEFLSACEGLGLRAWPGVEMDCSEPVIGFKGELLAYFPGGSYLNTELLLAEVRADRRRMVDEAIRRADLHFVRTNLSFDALSRKKLKGGAPLDAVSFSKIDVYYYLLAEGAIPKDVNYRTFKKAYFDSGILSGEPRRKPNCLELASRVKADGGFLVLPHPGHLFDDDAGAMKGPAFGVLLDYLVELGLGGVELYYYRKGDGEKINALVEREGRRRGLLLTYGSDCHGPGSGKDTIELFRGKFKGFPGGWESESRAGNR